MRDSNPSTSTDRAFASFAPGVLAVGLLLMCGAANATSPSNNSNATLLASNPNSGASNTAWQAGLPAGRIKGMTQFNRIVAKAQQNDWATLPFSELIGRIAKEFEGTPYVAGTLELSTDKEIPSVDFRGLDCVTFFETTLDMARMLQQGGHTANDLLRQIELTRYRDGQPGDYTSRLHYTTDWFFNNQAKHVVTIESGTQPFPKKINFMSTHPQLYPALKAHHELSAKMQEIEKTINARNAELRFVPNDALAEFEKTLQTGDIVGIVTDAEGLDISHTGLVIVDEKHVPHFMDASSKTGVMKVVLEPESLSGSIQSRKHALGAIFARPVAPDAPISELKDTTEKPHLNFSHGAITRFRKNESNSLGGVDSIRKRSPSR